MKPNKALLLLLLSIVFAWPCLAQREKKQKKEKKLPENIEEIKSKFTFNPFYTYQTTVFGISKKMFSDYIKYRPNVLGSVGCGFSVNSIRFGFSIKVPASERNTSEFGSTKYRSFSLGMQMRIVGLNAYYERYKSFYLDRPGSHFDTWNDSLPHPTYPGLDITTAGGYIHFVFTKSFSINAAFDQTERQKKSAGSFMIMLSDRYTKIEVDTSIVPAKYQSEYEEMSKYRTGGFNTIFIAPGCGYSIVKGYFSITPIVLMGAGLQVQYYKTTETNRLRGGLPLYMSFKNAIGYNSDRFFAQLIFAADFNRYWIKDTHMKLSFISVKGGLGYRFL